MATADILCFVCCGSLPSEIDQKLVRRLRSVLELEDGSPALAVLETAYLCTVCNLKLLQIEELITDLKEVYHVKAKQLTLLQDEGGTPAIEASQEAAAIVPEVITTATTSSDPANPDTEGDISTPSVLGDHTYGNKDGTVEVPEVPAVKKRKLDCGCGAIFTEQHDLEVHRRDNHGGGIVCRDCGLTLTDAAQIKAHSNAHTSDAFKCIICGEGFSQIPSLKLHQRFSTSCSSHFEVEDDLNCGCGAEFKTPQEFRLHREKEHGGRFACGMCKKTYSSHVHLQRHHQQVHNKDNKEKPSPQRKSQRERKTTDSSDKDIKEEEQPSTSRLTPRQRSLRKTRVSASVKAALAEEGEDYIDDDNDEDYVANEEPTEETTKSVHLFPATKDPQEKSKVLYLCPVCDRENKSEAVIQSHINRNHWTVMRGGKKYKCVLCEEVCKTLHGMVTHARSHRSQMWQCTECRFVLPTTDFKQRNDHIKEYHKLPRATPLKMYACQCAAMFTTRPALGFHRFVTHCDYSMTQKVTAEELLYSCNYCPCVFPTQTELTTHIDVHLDLAARGIAPGDAEDNSQEIANEGDGQNKSTTTSVKRQLLDILLPFTTLEVNDCTVSKTKAEANVNRPQTDDPAADAFLTVDPTVITEEADSTLETEVGASMEQEKDGESSTVPESQGSEQEKTSELGKVKQSLRFKSGQRQFVRYHCPHCDCHYHGELRFADHVIRYHWQPKGTDRFSCSSCTAEFEYIKEIIEHVQKQHRSELSACENCSFVFADIVQRNKHRSKDHQGSWIQTAVPAILNCGQCEARFESRSLLAYHSIMEHDDSSLLMEKLYNYEERCSHCTKSFTSKYMLDRHMALHHKRKVALSNRWKSRFGKKRKRKLTALGTKVATHDSEPEDENVDNSEDPAEKQEPGLKMGVSKDMCPVCDSCFYVPKAFDRHIKDFHWTCPSHGTFQCRQCGEGAMFDNLVAMVMHARECQRDSFLLCKVCTAAFPLEEQPQRTKHRAFEHRDVRTRPPTEYPCHCGVVFKDTSSLSFHMMTQHEDTSMRVWIGEDAFPCNYCDKTFTQERDLVVHIRLHKPTETSYDGWIKPDPEKKRVLKKSRVRAVYTKQKSPFTENNENMELEGFTVVDDHYKCNQCQRKLATFSGASKHSCRCPPKTSYLCSNCGRVFKHKHSFDLHQSNEHVLNGNFECTTCRKRFLTRQVLNKHMTTHTRPHVCGYCGKRFSQLPHLREHEGMHTGDQKFVCNICDQRFTWRMSLRRHLLVVHQVGKEPKATPMAICKLCNLSMSAKTRTKHFRKKHKGVQYSLDYFTVVEGPVVADKEAPMEEVEYEVVDETATAPMGLAVEEVETTVMQLNDNIMVDPAAQQVLLDNGLTLVIQPGNRVLVQNMDPTVAAAEGTVVQYTE